MFLIEHNFHFFDLMGVERFCVIFPNILAILQCVRKRLTANINKYIQVVLWEGLGVDGNTILEWTLKR